jgi:hypothetical protein
MACMGIPVSTLRSKFITATPKGIRFVKDRILVLPILAHLRATPKEYVNLLEKQILGKDLILLAQIPQSPSEKCTSRIPHSSLAYFRACESSPNPHARVWIGSHVFSRRSGGGAKQRSALLIVEEWATVDDMLLAPGKGWCSKSLSSITPGQCALAGRGLRRHQELFVGDGRWWSWRPVEASSLKAGTPSVEGTRIQVHLPSSDAVAALVDYLSRQTVCFRLPWRHWIVWFKSLPRHSLNYNQILVEFDTGSR